jgi:hypothetical protein
MNAPILRTTVPRSYVICQYPVGDLLLDLHGFLDSTDYGYEITGITLEGDKRDLCELFDAAGIKLARAYANENAQVAA